MNMIELSKLMIDSCTSIDSAPHQYLPKIQVFFFNSVPAHVLIRIYLIRYLLPINFLFIFLKFIFIESLFTISFSSTLFLLVTHCLVSVTLYPVAVCW